MEDYTVGFFEMKKAYNLLNENQKKFPGFIANKKSLGLIHTMVGTIPDKYRWATNLLGIEGTVPQGMAELKEVMDYGQTHPFLFEDETRYFYTLLKLYLENDEKAAWQLTEDTEYPSLKDNPLSVYVKTLVASRMKKNDVAIQLISSHTYGPKTFVPYFVWYMRGVTKMRRLDADAMEPLHYFVDRFKGSNYLKDAYRYLAWSYLLKGDEAKYRYWLSFCKTKGRIFTDADREALEELEKGIPPNLILLKARLLTDGAYYDAALQLLRGKTENDFTLERDKLEFTYRLARIYHESENIDQSIPYYVKTLTAGEKLPYYFADNSSLHLGMIYESRKDYDRARYYYSKCLSMKDNAYKTSIDQKAKAGLNRVDGK